MSKISFDQRFSVSLAASQFIRACLQVDKSALAFHSASTELRDAAPPQCKFVIDVDFQPWLIEVKPNGELDAEQIEHL